MMHDGSLQIASALGAVLGLTPRFGAIKSRKKVAIAD